MKEEDEESLMKKTRQGVGTKDERSRRFSKGVNNWEVQLGKNLK